MIFAVFDPSPLTVCINCSFFTFIEIGGVPVTIVSQKNLKTSSETDWPQEGLQFGSMRSIICRILVYHLFNIVNLKNNRL